MKKCFKGIVAVVAVAALLSPTIANASVQGVTNRGVIYSDGANNGVVNSDIVNRGVINAGGENNGVLNNDIINKGVINNDSANNGVVNNDVVNQGVINEGGINRGVINNDVVNKGVINEGGINRGVINNDIVNKGVINSGDNSADTGVVNGKVNNGIVNNDIVNNGVINAHTITFANSGARVIGNAEIPHGTVMPYVYAPSYVTGNNDVYVFNGWYTDPACTVRYDFEAPVTRDVVLYPKWVQDNSVDLSSSLDFKYSPTDVDVNTNVSDNVGMDNRGKFTDVLGLGRGIGDALGANSSKGFIEKNSNVPTAF